MHTNSEVIPDPKKGAQGAGSATETTATVASLVNVDGASEVHALKAAAMIPLTEDDGERSEIGAPQKTKCPPSTGMQSTGNVEPIHNGLELGK